MIYSIIYLFINCIGLGIVLSKHGEQREEKYSFGRTFLCLCFELWLLYKGGFFNDILARL